MTAIEPDNLPTLPQGVIWQISDLAANARLATGVHQASGFAITGQGSVILGPNGELLAVHSALTRNKAALDAFCFERYELGVTVSDENVTQRLRDLSREVDGY